MKLTAQNVGDVLETTLGYRVEMTTHGFDLTTAHELTPRRARLRSGSGIAGNSDVWWLVALPEGRPVIAGNLRTKAKLARAVLEFMAGPLPPPLSDYTVPRAKRVIVPRTGESRFVWYRRKKKRCGAPLPKPDAASGWPGLVSQGERSRRRSDTGSR